MTRFTTAERDDLKVWARIHVRGGYEPIDEIEDILLDLTEEFDSRISERDRQSEIRSAVIQEIEALRSEQAEWSILTDFDRLELAFDMLEDKDIVARQNFTCCGSCGATEIGIEIEEFEAYGRPARGYVFFHQQDTESAIETGHLYLSYGASRNTADGVILEVGQEIVDTLKSVGLKVHWDGKLEHRIGVSLAWQRRWEGPVPQPLKRWPF
ncbi:MULTISPECIES: DUF6891 domain-containing protein [Hyphomonas]|uniref:DUF6891 domain-containing protein n=1 Tax=Hyphomonas TaxID=85 RepID=UPI003513A271